MPRPEPWTKEDLRDLKKITSKRVGKYKKIDWDAVSKRFPNRSKSSITNKIRRKGWSQGNYWSRAEDKILREHWNLLGIRSLLKKLPGRTKFGVYERARRLGLHAGTPQGMVSVKALSDDPLWGYDYYKTLKILTEMNVRIYCFSYAANGKSKSKGVRYVEHDQACDAAKKWEARRIAKLNTMEFTRNAAKRLHVRVETLWIWLTEAGLVPPRTGTTKRQFQAAPEVFDQVFAARCVRRRKLPTVRRTQPEKASPPESTEQSQRSELPRPRILGRPLGASAEKPEAQTQSHLFRS